MPPMPPPVTNPDTSGGTSGSADATFGFTPEIALVAILLLVIGGLVYRHVKDSKHTSMSLTTAVVTTVASLLGISSSDDTGPNGADAVKQAVDELETIRTKTFDVTLGEPTVYPNGGEFFSDPKVIIPLKDVPFNAVNSLVFDLPDGYEDEYSQFMELLDLFGIDFDDLELVEGSVVPMTFLGGNAFVDWEEVYAGDGVPTSETTSDEVGAKDEPMTEEEVHEHLEGADNEQPTDDGSDEEMEFEGISTVDTPDEGNTESDDFSDESVATVEEETISPNSTSSEGDGDE